MLLVKAELEEGSEPGAEHDGATPPASSQLAKGVAQHLPTGAVSPDQGAIFPTVRVVADSPTTESLLVERIVSFQLPVLIRGGANEESGASSADVIVVAPPHLEAVLRRARAVASRTTHTEVLILGTGATVAARAKRCGLNGPAIRYLPEATFEPALVELVFCALPLRRLTSRLVGRMSLKDVQRHVRTAMLLEAFTRAEGSRRLTARMLGVTRPAVQQMLATLDLLEDEEAP